MLHALSPSAPGPARAQVFDPRASEGPGLRRSGQQGPRTSAPGPMRAQVFGAWASEGPGLRRPGRRGPRTSAPKVRCADGPTLGPAGAAQLPPTSAASVAALTAPAASSAGNPGASPRRGVSPAACSARTRHSPQRRHSSLGRHGALRGRGKGAQYPTACFTPSFSTINRRTRANACLLKSTWIISQPFLWPSLAFSSLL